MDGETQIGLWTAIRRTDKPIRREPVPILSPSMEHYYQDHPMGNDVHLYDWMVTHNGTTYTNIEPLEHRSADGVPALMLKVLKLAWE